MKGPGPLTRTGANKKRKWSVALGSPFRVSPSERHGRSGGCPYGAATSTKSVLSDITGSPPSWAHPQSAGPNPPGSRGRPSPARAAALPQEGRAESTRKKIHESRRNVSTLFVNRGLAGRPRLPRATRRLTGPFEIRPRRPRGVWRWPHQASPRRCRCPPRRAACRLRGSPTVPARRCRP